MALVTWNDIVRRAMIEIGALEGSGTPTTAEFGSGIDDLQSMLDEWALEGLLVPGLAHYKHTIGSPAKSVFTISTDAAQNPDIVDIPPIEIEVLGYRRAGAADEFPMVQTSYVVLKANAYAEGTVPTLFYYENEDPVGRVFFNTGTLPGDSFTIAGEKYLTPADIQGTANHNLPRGYERAVMLNLAISISAQYGVKGGLAQSTMVLAARGKRNITKRNVGVMALRLDRSVTMPSGSGLRRYRWTR